jgi:hypothetical protein
MVIIHGDAVCLVVELRPCPPMLDERPIQPRLHYLRVKQADNIEPFFKSLKEPRIYKKRALYTRLHLYKDIKQFVKRCIVMSEQCNIDLCLTVEVKENWKHLLFNDIIAFKTGHFKYDLKSVQVVVTVVVQKVVVVVAHNWRKEAEDLIVSDGHVALQHRITNQ